VHCRSQTSLLCATNSTPVPLQPVQLYNGPRSIMTAYQQTLDGLMQQAIDDSDKMNSIQLIILAVEGGFVGMGAVLVMWLLTSRLVNHRYQVSVLFHNAL
jgi:hypothetical protein